MRRTQIYLEEPLDARLREAARAQGRSAAALVREAVAAYLSTLPRRAGGESDPDPLVALVGAFEGTHREAAEHHDRYLYGRNSGNRRP